MTAKAVAPGAPPPVVIAADLPGLGLCGVFWASHRDPGFLGWPTRGKKRAVRGRVGGGEAVVTPGPGAGFARPCEGFGVKLWEARQNLAAFLLKATSYAMHADRLYSAWHVAMMYRYAMRSIDRCGWWEDR